MIIDVYGSSAILNLIVGVHLKEVVQNADSTYLLFRIFVVPCSSLQFLIGWSIFSLQ